MTDVWSHAEFDHTFVVVQLDEPDAKGRAFRLFDNGAPAFGGQWHYSLANAIARAQYILQCDYTSRIAFLTERVQKLEAQIARAS